MGNASARPQRKSLGRRFHFETLEPRHVLSVSGLFNCVDPLEAPADGNVALFIDDFGVNGGPSDNTFVARKTAVTIQAGRTYTVTAAAGRGNDQPAGDQSIQVFVECLRSAWAPEDKASPDEVEATASNSSADGGEVSGDAVAEPGV